MLYVGIAQRFLVFDVIEITSFALTLNIDTEHFFNGQAVSVEGDSVHWQTSAHFCTYPALVQFLKRDASRAVNVFSNPGILFENIVCFHGIKV